MNSVHRSRRQLVLVLAILGLVVSGSQVAHIGSAQSAPVTSSLVIDATAQSPGSVTVTGQNFTPGGRVYVALYDQWGMRLHETRWIVASRTVYEPMRSDDPTAGFVPGGAIEAIFGVTGSVEGSSVAIDEISGGSESIFPNGSHMSATEYVPVDLVDERVGNLCGATAMARAYDEQTDAWSNMLDIDAGC